MPKFYHVDSLSDRIPLNIVRKEVPLSPAEKQYLLAVERGDYTSVRHALEEAEIYFNININCKVNGEGEQKDPLGRTALQIAIQNENIEIIELLLRHHVHVGDALLHAIDEEVVEAVELLLNYKPPKKDMHVRILQEPTETDYDSDISPVILAAHRNNYEILKVLLERGASIPKPHDVKCGCDDCKASIRHDGLRHSRSRLNVYRALASSSLIALSSDDPVLTAFELSWELRKLSHRENEFKEEYEKLADNCRDFATMLLDQTRGSHELSAILNRDEDAPSGEEPLSRLRLAIKYKQKAFTAHPNCQQLLAEEWYQGLPGWRRQHWTLKVLISFFVGMSFPLLSLMYLIAPKTKLGRIIRLPFLKFICHSASYLVFVVLLLMASLDIGNNASSNRVNARGPSPTDVELLICWWIAGFVWAEIKQLWDSGFLEYLHDWWNLLDFGTNSLYMAVIGLRITAYVNIHVIKNERYGDPNLPRDQWTMGDPTLLAEAAFAIANVLSMLRLVYLFTANSHLGPLQISLGRMVEDILKFLFLIGLVLFSFAAGLNQLYWVYGGENQESEKDCFGVTCPEQTNDVFSNMFESLEALIWATLGQLQVSVTNVMPKHDITEFIGAVMLCFYNFITIIILLNLLIAMMNTSFQKIQTRADMEWKFARAKLWMSYFEEGNTLPPPFNTLPSPKSFYYLFRWIWRNVCCCYWKRKSLANVSRQRDQTQKKKEKDDDYQRVMKSLVKRFLKNSKRGEQEKGVTEDDLNEIKQDISSFRYEMLEILKRKEPTASSKIVKFQSESMDSISSDKNKSPSDEENSLHRVPSYLYRKGKKGKKSPVHQDHPTPKPLKIAPIQEEDYSMPEFLKVKNVKNVMIAVNELQKKSMRRRMSQIPPGELPNLEARRMSAALVVEPVPQEGALARNKPCLSDSGISESVEDPTSRTLDTVDEEAESRSEVSGSQDTSSSQVGEDNVSRRSSLTGRAPLRREKAFAGRLEDDPLHPLPQADPNAPSPDASGDSQGTSGIASTNNSFQSQDSTEDDGENTPRRSSNNNDSEEEDAERDDDEGEEEEEDEDEEEEEESEGVEEDGSVEKVNSSPLLGNEADQEVTEIPKISWQATRPSYVWAENTKPNPEEIDMSRYVYNGYNNMPH
ncbi:short transient receptor potential channel 4-like [Diadema setosum]|uniref:short transient receptor potential channel 4-like n=1 Tax=Diadema setosum TaxID=31175 RepID=UPI003B3A3C55